MSGIAGRVVAYTAALLLLGASLAASALPLSELRLGLHLGIAACQAALVFAIFMELRGASALVRIFALGGFLWLAIMLGFFALDYLHR